MSFSFNFIAKSPAAAVGLIRKSYAPECVKAAVVQALYSVEKVHTGLVEVTGSGHWTELPGDSASYQNLTISVRPLAASTE